MDRCHKGRWNWSRETSRCSRIYATHPRILWMEGRRGTASMSRGHQTGQARIATTSGPDDLQRVTRREFNRARSNKAWNYTLTFVYVSLISTETKLHVASDLSLSLFLSFSPRRALNHAGRIFFMFTMRKTVEKTVTQWNYLHCARFQTSFPIELTCNGNAHAVCSHWKMEQRFNFHIPEIL